MSNEGTPFVLRASRKKPPMFAQIMTMTQDFKRKIRTFKKELGLGGIVVKNVFAVNIFPFHILEVTYKINYLGALLFVFQFFILNFKFILNFIF